jgi:hypothetical protein
VIAGVVNCLLLIMGILLLVNYFDAIYIYVSSCTSNLGIQSPVLYLQADLWHVAVVDSLVRSVPSGHTAVSRLYFIR